MDNISFRDKSKNAYKMMMSFKYGRKPGRKANFHRQGYPGDHSGCSLSLRGNQLHIFQTVIPAVGT